MDAKVTLSFEQEVIESAKKFADKQGISLSRLTEFLYRKITAKSFSSLEDLPISDWVSMVAEGEAEYKTRKRTRKQTKEIFYKSKR